MGEVGANATETTTAETDALPKENGEVNGTVAPEVVSLKKAAVVAATNPKGNSSSRSTEGGSEEETADDTEDGGCGDVDGQKTVGSSEPDADKEEKEEEETSKASKEVVNQVAKAVDAAEEQDEEEEKQTDGSGRGTTTPPARAPSSERGSPKVTDASEGDGTQSKQPNSSSSGSNKRRHSSSSSETAATTMNSSRSSAENGGTKRPPAPSKTPSSSPVVLPNLAEVTIEKLPQRKDDKARTQKKVKVDGVGVIDLDLDDDDDEEEEEAAAHDGSGHGKAKQGGSQQNGRELDGGNSSGKSRSSGDNGSVDRSVVRATEVDRSSSVTQNGHQESEVEQGDRDGDVTQKMNPGKPKGNRPAVDTMMKQAEDGEEDEEEDEGEEDDDKPVSINSDSDGGGVVAAPAETENQHRSTVKPKVTDEAEQQLVAENQKKMKTEGSDRRPAADTVRVATPEVVQKSLHSGSSSKPANGGFPVAISNQNGDGSGDCDGDVTFLSDKEDDCVVIEDDEVDGELPPTTGSAKTPMVTESGTVRSRSSASRSRRSLPSVTMLHTGGAAPPSLVSTDDEDDDDDDDIQEIIDDPLAPETIGGAMRGSGSLLGAVGGGGQLGSYPLAYKGSSQKSLLMNSGGGASMLGSTGSGSGTGKDPPTLVIIDTNTLMNNQRSANVLGAAGAATSGIGSNASLLAKAAAMAAGGSPVGGGAFGMAGNALAVAAAAAGGQFMGNSRSLLNSVSPSASSVMGAGGAAGVLMAGAGSNFAKVVPPSLTPVTPLLPALTDDMFVLEAPSFIVPYIYEKPPVDNLRDIVDDLEVKIKEMRKTLEEAGGSVDPHGVETADAAEGPDKKDAASSNQQSAADASATAEASAPDTAEKAPADTSRKRKRPTDDDDEWDELDTSTDDEASDEEQKTKVLIKEVKADIESHIILPSSEKDVLGGGGSGVGSESTAGGGDAKKSENYFENPLGKFFMNIGINLVQEFVQTDLLRQQKRKRDREGKPSPSTQLAINSLMKNLEQSKENNKPYKFEVKRCEYCPFRSESSLVMAHHYETPHMRNFVYKCNFCAYETRPPHDILFHMEAVHNIKGRMEKALSYHHCPNCLFEDNGKSKLARHAVACAKKFRPEINLNPPVDWEPPAKIPRIKPKHGLVGTATAYQAMTAQQQKNLALANQQRINQQHVQQSVQLTQQHLAAHQALQQQQQQHAQSLAAAQQHLGIVSVNAANVNNLANLSPAAQAAAMRARAVGSGGAGNMGGVGRAPSIIPSPTGITAAAAASLRTAGGAGVNVAAAASAAIRNTLAGAGMVIPNNLQLSASALAAAAVAGGFSKYAPNSLNAGRSLLANTNSSITIQNVSNMKTTKTAQAPSISITPLPRQSSSSSANMANIAGALSKLQSQGTAVKPGQIPGGGKTAFVVCEICDGYIKDLDQLRNHMQWIHKVKIHPKMIYNRPPLNCQKCQYRFFTDQGLERHLLGSHGLVTSSMQEAANKGKDAGRCPVCGRVYQWKLLNHVSRDHSMTLKPAHLSYKCTVCTATFGMYKQFESHVYSAHSTVAKKTVDSKGKGGGNVQQSAMNLIGNSAASSAGSGSSSSGMRGGGGGDSLLKPLKINDEITIIPQPTSNSSKMMKTIELESHVID